MNAGAATWEIDIPSFAPIPTKYRPAGKSMLNLPDPGLLRHLLRRSGMLLHHLHRRTVLRRYAQCDLVYPYFPPCNGYWNLNGMVITNLSSFEGTATVNYYEADGDAGTVDVTVMPTVFT